MDDKTSLANFCVGVIFFGESLCFPLIPPFINSSATPNHGSSVLSENAYVQTIKNQLCLKWEMSIHLRHDFTLENPDLKRLNDSFIKSAAGVSLYSYVETGETELNVLSPSDAGGEILTSVSLLVVDGKSASLGTTNLPVGDEVKLNTTHALTPKFVDEKMLYDFIDHLDLLIQNFSSIERGSEQAFMASIMKDVKVEIHQFYQSGSEGTLASMKVWSESPSLQAFLDLGPTECLNRGLKKPREDQITPPNGKSRPSIEIELSTPQILIAHAPSTENDSSPKKIIGETLPTSLGEDSKIAHARRQSLTNNFLAPGPSGESAPERLKSVQFNTELQHGLRTAHPPIFKLPSISSGRFKWIHIPFTHCEWVPVCDRRLIILFLLPLNPIRVFSQSSLGKRPRLIYTIHYY